MAAWQLPTKDNGLATAQKIHEIKLPGVGSVETVSGRFNETQLYYRFTSMTNPGGIYGIDFSSAPTYDTKHFWQTKIPGWNEDDYAVDRIFYKSKDGTDIPMFAVRHKSVLPTLDSKPEKPIPTLVYVYGGFGESTDLSFSQSRNIWMKNYGGMYVVAAIRGGGEYGEEWHQ